MSEESLLYPFITISGFQSFSSGMSRGKHSWCNTLVSLRLLTVCKHNMAQLGGTSLRVLAGTLLLVLCHSPAAIQCTEDTGIKILALKFLPLPFYTWMILVLL